MERKLIRESITKAAEELGYLAMKAVQVDIVIKVEMFLLFFQLALEKACAMPACQ